MALVAATTRCNPVLDLGSNQGSDASSDGEIGICNVNDGLCRPGLGCDPDACTHCVCDDVHVWYCSSTCDAGTDCPLLIPSERSPCSADSSRVCPYASGCHEPDAALCIAGFWQIYHGHCPPAPRCPPSSPAPGAPCNDSLSRCTWRNDCGVSFSGTCVGNLWSISPPVCTLGACPSETPAARASCPEVGAKCEWTSTCGTPDYGFCTAGGWSISTTCTPLQCPMIPPAAGSPCEGEGTKCSWPAGCPAGTYLEATCTARVWVFGTGCK